MQTMPVFPAPAGINRRPIRDHFLWLCVPRADAFQRTLLDRVPRASGDKPG
ncbi:hypothetical protein ACVH53_001151 [Salmonella enterica]|nr:hypothetical protein [Salmonella enterica]